MRVDDLGTIEGVRTVCPDVHADGRGRFVETYRREWFPGSNEAVQANLAQRQAGAVVGLHYHHHQSDYWWVVVGHAHVVLHDLRVASPTDGVTAELDLGEVAGDPHNNLGLYIPPGVAHGFAAVSDLTLTYLVDRTYDPADELGVAWDDPDVGADWLVPVPVLSGRDQANPLRRDLHDGARPHHRPGA